jgi:ApaG protein
MNNSCCFEFGLHLFPAVHRKRERSRRNRVRRQNATMSKPEFTNEVRVQYLPEQSHPPDGPYAFAYTVTIRNSGGITAQLVARHWVVTDANNNREDVRGLAVVGHQPLLRPGETFEYSSWTRIDTPHGSMRGTFFCMTEDARPFDSPVPEFALVFPGALH